MSDDLLRETHRKNARTLDFVPIVNVELDDSEWREQNAAVDITGHEDAVRNLILEVYDNKKSEYHTIMRRYAKGGIPWLSKAQLLNAYRQLIDVGMMTHDPDLVIKLQTKPTRSQAGVTVVTVLTKPFPCPGKCIFCPTDVRMPKSYLHDEPGAQRAERHNFDPYAQTASRITALDKIGHPTDKIELLILGGTWSSYPRDYQEWFVKRCFDAMNGMEAPDLPTAHAFNVNGKRRNVGLVVETRQDNITEDELRWMRYLGVTKVQIGIQSLDERVLKLNDRGHDVQATRDGFRLLRLAGFKIHGHWMANLLGATLDGDRDDYLRLWSDPAVRPDELKIYPCMLVKNADLYQHYLRGEYEPYTEDDLRDLLIYCLTNTPRYARLTRVIRDIPTTNVVAGNKKANLRQLAQEQMKKERLRGQDIRSREVRRERVKPEDLSLKSVTYETDATVEHFLSFETSDDKIAGFLRLSLPSQRFPHPIMELVGTAMIREVHVYGPALTIGTGSQGEAQHSGLGASLIERAKEMAQEGGYEKLAVISAVGTQGYYAKHGFETDGLYMTCQLASS